MLREKANQQEETLSALYDIVNELRSELRGHNPLSMRLQNDTGFAMAQSYDKSCTAPLSESADDRVVKAFFRLQPAEARPPYSYNGVALGQLIKKWQCDVRQTSVVVDEQFVVSLLKKTSDTGAPETPQALQRQIVENFLLLHPSILSDYFNRSVHAFAYWTQITKYPLMACIQVCDVQWRHDRYNR